MNTNKQHWENVFETKTPQDVSWTQDYPQTAVDYLQQLNLPKSAKIIDVGGGDSKLVDALLDLGYYNIWVLDISSQALENVKKRLGEKANEIHFIVSDIAHFQTEEQFDFWYDRACFHFLTTTDDIKYYVNLVQQSLVSGGHFLLGTFSNNGPLKCSGLDITQYSEEKMQATFNQQFAVVKCFDENHTTPFGTVQHFQFCGFVKK